MPRPKKWQKDQKKPQYLKKLKKTQINEDTAAHHFHSLPDKAVTGYPQIPGNKKKQILLLGGEKARPHFRRACGMGGNVAGIFGK